MPSKSEAQHNAMEAAAHGKSTLGIPARVGKEFVAADKGHPMMDMPMHVKALRSAGKLPKKGKGKKGGC